MKKNKNKKRKTSLKTIIWILFMFVSSFIVAFFFQGANLFSSLSNFLKFGSFGWIIGFTFWGGHSLIGYYTDKKLDWTKNLKKANIISLLMLIIFGLIACPILFYVFDRFVLEMSGQDLYNNVIIKGTMMFSIDMIVISIYYSTNLTKYWRKSIEKNEELKRENLVARYEVLKNKVNPHFLFNSLNTLSSVVERKPELSNSFIKKLSDIYRYVLEQSDRELVSLATEMKFVEDYIFLSKIRFGDALTFHSAIPENTNIQVVPLGLQTLVENAIKHNIISDDMPLQIDVGMEDEFIVLKNNIQKKNIIMPDRKPHGLENLKNRYTYHTDLLIEITESDEFFTVSLPIIKSKNHELFDN